jgi:hypothetical protein
MARPDDVTIIKFVGHFHALRAEPQLGLEDNSRAASQPVNAPDVFGELLAGSLSLLILMSFQVEPFISTGLQPGGAFLNQ